MSRSVADAREALEEARNEAARTGSSASLARQRQAQSEYQSVCEKLDNLRRDYENQHIKELNGWFRLGEEAQSQGRWDDAIRCYNEVLAVQSDEADVHWRKLMCHYGVEYVREQTSGCYLPTITRIQADNLLENADFRAACEYAASEEVLAFYRREGTRLNELLHKYQYINGTEVPCDVFISVKQGDDDGRPTTDSQVGLRLYHRLSEMGLRVFNSTESLKDKVGTEYEPYIMHALMSAKMLVVVASREDYLNARWIRNEWRRFGHLRREEGAASARRLVVYSVKPQGMLKIPTEMGEIQILDAQSDPEPVAHLCQLAQSVCQKEIPLPPILDRMFMELEDGEFEEADSLYKEALNSEPRNGYLYLGKLMIEHRLCSRDDLANLDESFETSPHFRKIMRFGDEALKLQVQGYLTAIAERAENARRQGIYEQAQAHKAAHEWDQAAELFLTVIDYADSRAQIAECEEGKLTDCYEHARSLMTEHKWNDAIALFTAVIDHADSRDRISECEEGIRADEYERAHALHRDGDHDGAMRAFLALGDYRDSRLQAETCRADNAEAKADARAQAQLNALKAQNAENWAMLLMLLDVLVPQDRHATVMELMKLHSGAAEISAAYDGMVRQNPLYQAEEYWKQGKRHEALLAYRKSHLYGIRPKDTDCAVKWFSPIAGYDHTVGLKSDGTVTAAGSNTYGQCDVGGWRDIVAIAAGDYHTVGLKSDGTVTVTGLNDHGQCNVGEWCDIVAVTAGYEHTVGLKSDGTVTATGYNGSGQCNVGNWHDVVAIAAGTSHTVGLKADGTVLATGRNSSGQCDVDGWRGVAAIAAGAWHTVGLKADGTVLAIGDNGDGQCNVGGWRDIVAIAAGTSHTVGLKADGTVLATGKNDEGQCSVYDWNLLN